MQLQIECNQVPLQQPCLICSQLFEMAEAKVLIYNEGKHCGEVCPKCLKKGFDWLSDRFEQLNQPKKKVTARQPQREIEAQAVSKIFMNSSSDTDKNTVTIYQLLEELKNQFHVVEKQIKLKLSPQSELDPVEVVIPESLLVLEDSSFMTD